MDFTNLFLAPVAAVITASMIIIFAAVRSRSEEKALIPAAATAFVANLLLVGPWPWYYLTWAAFREGMGAVMLLSTLGFAIGALFALVVVKGLRVLRIKLLSALR